MGITERKKMMDFAEKFRSKRKELGFSQAVLAEGICEQSQISKIERGNYMPAADLLYKLEGFCNIETKDIFRVENIKGEIRPENR